MYLCVAADLWFQGKGYDEQGSGSWKKLRGAVGNCDITLYPSKGTASLTGCQHLLYTS